MKVTCPSCHATIPAADVALDKGWAKCVRCDEVFPLASLLPGYSVGRGKAKRGPTERPFDAWAILKREPRLLAVHLPAQGMRAAAWGTLFFTTFWLVFTAFWTCGALGVFGGGAIRWDNVGFAAFSIPFWGVGFGVLGGVVWMARGTRSMMIDPARVVTELRCLFFRRIRSIDREAVQCARPGERHSRHEGKAATPAVDLIFTKGSFQIPCTSEAEQKWLVREINDFLQTVPYDPAMRDWMSEPPREFVG